MSNRIPLAIMGLALLAACTGPAPSTTTEAAGTHAATPEAPATAHETGDEAERYGADSLLSVLGPVQGKVVADLFAGDGYYTWKLLAAGARVLAIDPDPANVAALQARKKQEGIGDDRLLVRLTQPGEPGLLPNEADLALINHEFSDLGDRQAWFSKLQAGVRPPHIFALVGYVPFQTPYGTPLSQRMDYNTVADELTGFGYGDVAIFYKKLRYRYIIMAAVPPQD